MARTIPFLDGIYHFETGAFLPSDSEGMPRIERPFPAVKDEAKMREVRSRILGGIIAERDIDYFLAHVARALAQHSEDDEWLLCLGSVNSGKSILERLNENAWGDDIAGLTYFEYFERSKKTKTTPNLSKLLQRHATHRLVFTNQANYTEGRHMIGNIVQEAFLDRGIRLIMMGSSVPDILGPEQDKLQIIKLPYKYAMTEGREGTHKADHTIHEYIRQQDTIDAYTWLVLEAYRTATPTRQ